MNISLTFAFVAVVMTCAPPQASAEQASLYERLGGEPVVMKVSKQTLARVASDPTVNQSFDQVDLPKLEVKLFEHLCSLTGGGCKYTGDDMKTAHAGLNIRQAEFYAMVEALRAALDANGVGEREKNELLRLLAPMKRDVVTR